MFNKYEPKDTLIMVTHAPIEYIFSWPIMAKRFDKQELLLTPTPETGYHINLNKGSYILLPKG